MTPPLLLGCALALWGWQADFLVPALAMGVILEGARLSPRPLALEARDYARVADLCTALLIATVGWLLLRGNLLGEIQRLLTWLPMLLFPLVAAQFHGADRRVPLAALALTLRRRGPDEAPLPWVDVSHAYLCAVLLAGAASNQGREWFYPVLVGFAAWTLWPHRPRAHRAPAALLILVLAAGLGYAVQGGLLRLQRAAEDLAMPWLMENFRLRQWGNRTTTRIGELGRIKLSDRIVLRARLPADADLPVLLRDAAYSRYEGGSWSAGDAPFRPLLPDDSGVRWEFAPGPPGRAEMELTHDLVDGRGLLLGPAGTTELSGPALGLVEVNPLGTRRAAEGPARVSYRLRYHPGGSDADAPLDEDLAVPPRLAPDLARILAEAGVADPAAAGRVAAVREFFARHFRYSLYLGPPGMGGRTLVDFLRRDREGHCEYFASATVLLLRQAGVPARYVTGWSVDEWSSLDQRYLARARHGHAWAEAWVDGRWLSVDTTPSEWSEREAARNASPFQALMDVYSWLAWRYGLWRDSPAGLDPALAWLTLPLLALLAWRLARRRQPAPPAVAAASGATPPAPSPFDALAARLALLAHPPRPGQTLAAWVGETRALAQLPAELAAPLPALLHLHYRLRFDPRGLPEGEFRALEDGVRRWLAEARGA